MNRWRVWMLALVLGAGCLSAAAQQRLPAAGAEASKGQRIALVIGNADYAKGPLKNPVNDANDVGAALRRLGFQVMLRTNVNRAQMRAAVRDFGVSLRAGGVGLFYFAGHGVESKGKNFLIPLAASMDNEFELEDEAVDANSVLRAMEEAGNPTNIMILDACRDNPFVRSWRSASTGLAQMNAPSGSFIAFATSPGSVAADGTGRNGLFTKHFLGSLAQPDLDIDRVFTRITAAVTQETGKKQVPWKASSLTGTFSFSSGNAVAALSPSPATTPAPTPAPALDPSVNDRLFWESVKDTRNPEELRAYLSQFPQGLFVALAGVRLKALQTPPAAAPVAALTPPPARDLAVSAEEAQARGVRLIDMSNPNRDDAAAVRLFRWAADQGHAGARTNLGFMNELGRGGLAKDETEAVRLYRLAANQGDAVAQTNLGAMYESGRGGLTTDDAEAVRLYRLAANQGYMFAQTNLGWMYESGRGGLAKDDVEAARLYRLAASQGHARAQTNLAWMYQSGYGGLAKDDTEAVRLYRLAVNQGFARAQINLGFMYETGRGGLARDEAEAVKFYRLAANQSEPVAQANLGNMYEYGKGGLQKDVSAAKSWYRLAARQGNVRAQNELKRLGESW